MTKDIKKVIGEISEEMKGFFEWYENLRCQHIKDGTVDANMNFLIEQVLNEFKNEQLIDTYEFFAACDLVNAAYGNFGVSLKDLTDAVRERIEASNVLRFKDKINE